MKREKKWEIKLYISSLEGKMIIVVLQGPWYKSCLKKVGSAATGKKNSSVWDLACH
jgi:hypothetical protein